jgi:RNA recognition motif-containing protein
MADALIEKYNGQSFMESPLKIEKALPRAKGKASEEAEEQAEPESEATQAKKLSKKGGKKRSNTPTTRSSSSDAFQPDPRWADQLAQLKEMLAAQTVNS